MHVYMKYVALYDTGVCEQSTPHEKNTVWNMSFPSTKSGGWRAASAAGFHDQGLRKGYFFFTDTSIIHVTVLLSFHLTVYLTVQYCFVRILMDFFIISLKS